MVFQPNQPPLACEPREEGGPPRGEARSACALGEALAPRRPAQDLRHALALRRATVRSPWWNRLGREIPAPRWLALSLMLHLAVILFLGPARVRSSRPAAGSLTAWALTPRIAGDGLDAAAPPPAPPPLAIETEPPPLGTWVLPPDPDTAEPGVPNFLLGLGTGGAETAWASPLGGDGGLRLDPALSGLSPAFRAHLDELRESPWEAMLLLDLTGSMAEGLAVTRAVLLEAVAALRLLVPGTRLGLLAFRDKPDEEARSEWHLVPLSPEPWGILTVLEIARPRGGGQPQESHLQPLAAALTTGGWREESRRVVILVGDAPGHPAETAGLDTLARAHRDRGGILHTVYAGPPAGRGPLADSAAAELARLAAAGGGTALTLKSARQATGQLLDLLLGGGFAADVDRVLENLQRRPSLPDRIARSRLAEGDVAWFRERILASPIPPGLVRAAVSHPRRQLLAELADLLAGEPEENQPQDPGGSVPLPSRQAALFILIKGLGTCGLGPDEALRGRPDPATLAAFRKEIARLP